MVLSLLAVFSIERNCLEQFIGVAYMSYSNLFSVLDRTLQQHQFIVGLSLG